MQLQSYRNENGFYSLTKAWAFIWGNKLPEGPQIAHITFFWKGSNINQNMAVWTFVYENHIPHSTAYSEKHVKYKRP
jgi:hypothetical protein